MADPELVESHPDIRKSLPEGWRLLTLPHGTNPFDDPWKRVAMSDARPVLAPDWLDDWAAAMNDRLADGQSLESAARGLATSPQIFDPNETRIERSRRWFLASKKSASLEIAYKHPTEGWLKWTATVSEESRRLQLTTPAPWSAEEREKIERSLIAHASSIHGTPVWTMEGPMMATTAAVLDNSTDELKNYRRIIEKLPLAKPSAVLDSITKTRFVEQDSMEGFQNYFSDVVSALKFLEGPVKQNLPRLFDQLNLAILYCHSMSRLAGRPMGGEPVRVAEALEPLRLHFNAWMRSGNVSGRWDVSGDLMQAQFEGDVAHLGLLIDNLITNAKQWAARQADAETPFMEVIGRRRGGELMLTVQNNGPFKLDTANWSEPLLGASARGGFGLGLSTIGYLTKDLGGDIEIERTAQGLSRVTFTMPLRDPLLPRALSDDPDHLELMRPSVGELRALHQLLNEYTTEVGSDFAILNNGPFVANVRALRKAFGPNAIIAVDPIFANIKELFREFREDPGLNEIAAPYHARPEAMPFIISGSVGLAVAIGWVLSREALRAAKEIIRILKPGGWLYANFSFPAGLEAKSVPWLALWASNGEIIVAPENPSHGLLLFKKSA